MKIKRCIIALALLALCLSAGAEELERTESRAAILPAAQMANQIVLVEYEGGCDATVSRHEKVNGRWEELDATYGYVGRTGMGKEKAGDNKTPLGTFNLTTPFGILDDPGAAQPYLKVTKYHYWCSTSDSKYYNQLVDSREAGRKGKKPDEILINYKGYYNYCMFIDYNAAGTPGKGACIFLHCIGGRDWTHGCIAVPEDYMREVVCWARAGTKIVILDAPITEADIALAEARDEAPDGEMPRKIKGTGGSTNIRSGPGLDYDILDALPKNGVAEYLGERELDERGVTWYLIRYKGDEGWVSEKYTSFLSE